MEKQVSAVAQRCIGTVTTLRKLNIPRETTKHVMFGKHDVSYDLDTACPYRLP